jgi:hypothetical protein
MSAEAGRFDIVISHRCRQNCIHDAALQRTSRCQEAGNGCTRRNFVASRMTTPYVVSNIVIRKFHDDGVRWILVEKSASLAEVLNLTIAAPVRQRAFSRKARLCPSESRNRCPRGTPPSDPGFFPMPYVDWCVLFGIAVSTNAALRSFMLPNATTSHSMMMPVVLSDDVKQSLADLEDMSASMRPCRTCNLCWAPPAARCGGPAR